MSEDIYQKANEVFEAVNSKTYSNSFFQHIDNALIDENRLEKIAKTFNLPENDAKKILAQAYRMHLDEKNNEKIEKYAQAIVTYASRAGLLQKLFDLAEESLIKGPDRIIRLATKFHIPEHLAHNVFNRAYEMVTDYTKTFNEEPSRKQMAGFQTSGD